MKAAEVKVKICGVTRPQDAVLAQAAGASYVGAVLVPESPRRVTPSQAREISGAVTVPLAIVIGDLDPTSAAAAAEAAGAGVIQLHGATPPENFADLRSRGGWELWKAVRVRSGADLLVALERFGEVVDLLLLDGWHPSLLGGSGTPFPWEEVSSLSATFPAELRMGAAGGLGPENVATVVRTLAPDLVDVSSGVEQGIGRKDPEKVREFIRQAAEASRSL